RVKFLPVADNVRQYIILPLFRDYLLGLRISKAYFASPRACDFSKDPGFFASLRMTKGLANTEEFVGVES
ncbi:MAG TPA: hypothetical protein VJ718_02340, partial [Candidatus Binataceae bacterium]|nr:hypothetical protein [Candidatus Binataceae bacterium]